MVSSAGVDKGRLFHGQKADILQTIFQKMGHAQPFNPIKTNNCTVSGIVNTTIKQKCSQSMDTILSVVVIHQKYTQFQPHEQQSIACANHGQSVDQPIVEHNINICMYIKYIYPGLPSLCNSVRRKFGTWPADVYRNADVLFCRDVIYF